MTKQLPTTTHNDNYCQSKLVICHPRFKRLYEVIIGCTEEATEYGESQCLYLSGQAGVGKSTLVQYYADQFPRYYTDEYEWRIPVLYLEISHPATIKGMSSALLHSLGDPNATCGTLASLNSRIRILLSECKVSVVILDDFHHVVNKKSSHNAQGVSDWLKALIKDTGIVFIVVGVDDEIDCIFETNKQLWKLFVSEKLLPFNYDPKNRVSIDIFAKLITTVQKSLDIRLSDELSPVAFLLQIYRATSGNMSEIMSLFRKAKQVYQEDNVHINANADTSSDTDTTVITPISLDSLSKAFESQIHKDEIQVNPFRLPVDGEGVPSGSVEEEIENFEFNLDPDQLADDDFWDITVRAT